MLQFQPSEKEHNGLPVASDWIRDLESDNSRLHKERVIEKALVAARLGSGSAEAFLYNCYLAYNPYFVYGIKQVPETVDLTGKENPWVEFWALCEKLRFRQITGDAARNAVQRMSEKFDSEQWNGLCRRVLIKDLRCGISVKTLNKVLGNSEWKIPVFEVQLAKDSKGHPNKLRGKVRVEPKLDGVRVIAICMRDGPVVMYSRNGKEFSNFPHIAEQLRWMANNAQYDIVFDGEVVGDSFQQLMRQANRKHDADASDTHYYIFDCMPLREFQEGHCNMQAYKRLNLLQSLYDYMDPLEYVHLVDQAMEYDLDKPEEHERMQQYAEYCVNIGFEGIMIKNMDAPYECKRNDHWLKWKPVITVDLEVTAVEAGTGRNEGRLGALVCEGIDQDREIKVNVGSGLSDSDRDSFWDSRAQVIGQVVEVQADAVTQNQDGTYSLRFPRFVRFRGFEPGEKI